MKLRAQLRQDASVGRAGTTSRAGRRSTSRARQRRHRQPGQPGAGAARVEQLRPVVRVVLRRVELSVGRIFPQEHRQLHRHDADHRDAVQPAHAGRRRVLERGARRAAARPRTSVCIRNYIFINHDGAPGRDAHRRRLGPATDRHDRRPARRPDRARSSITVPANQQSASLDGWEFNVQHVFGESGFGLAANYTIVDSGLTYDNYNLGEQFALEGLSDSANLVAFYEKGRWQVRAAYNWRDKFLSSTLRRHGLRTRYYVEAVRPARHQHQLQHHRQPHAVVRRHQPDRRDPAHRTAATRTRCCSRRRPGRATCSELRYKF